MKSYQGLFAQALYLAAKPLDKAEKQKLENASRQQQSLAQGQTKPSKLAS